MNITKEDVDALNAVITVDITTEDYQTKVTKVLQDYRKKADIPGFRKGYVPMGMVKKQYGKSIMIDEVNKLLQESLSNFLAEEKIDILGNPLPIIREDFSWDTEIFSFEFELGLIPEFTVNLSTDEEIVKYKIIAGDSFIDYEIEELRRRYEKTNYSDEVTEASKIIVTFAFNEEINSDIKETICLKDVKKSNLKKFVDAKADEVIEFEIKELSDDDGLMMFSEMYDDYISDNDISDDDISEPKITFTIEEITEIELAELNQEFFDKIFTDGSVKSVTELRSRIREDSEKRFKEQSDQRLLIDITEYLLENTKFDLPAEFLQKWLATSGENPMSKEQAIKEYEKSEEELRLQLIEGKILKDNNIKSDYQELVDYTKVFVRVQMAKFGNTNPEDKELDDISNRILGNPEEAKHLQEQLISQKLITFYKDNITLKTKEVSYEEFIKEGL